MVKQIRHCAIFILLLNVINLFGLVTFYAYGEELEDLKPPSTQLMITDEIPAEKVMSIRDGKLVFRIAEFTPEVVEGTNFYLINPSMDGIIAKLVVVKISNDKNFGLADFLGNKINLSNNSLLQCFIAQVEKIDAKGENFQNGIVKPKIKPVKKSEKDKSANENTIKKYKLPYNFNPSLELFVGGKVIPNSLADMVTAKSIGSKTNALEGNFNLYFPRIDFIQWPNYFGAGADYLYLMNTQYTLEYRSPAAVKLYDSSNATVSPVRVVDFSGNILRAYAFFKVRLPINWLNAIGIRYGFINNYSYQLNWHETSASKSVEQSFKIKGNSAGLEIESNPYGYLFLGLITDVSILQKVTFTDGVNLEESGKRSAYEAGGWLGIKYALKPGNNAFVTEVRAFANYFAESYSDLSFLEYQNFNFANLSYGVKLGISYVH